MAAATRRRSAGTKGRERPEAAARTARAELVLSAAERSALDEEGFVLFAGVLSPSENEEARAAVEAAFAEVEPSLRGGTRHTGELGGTSDAFRRLAAHPKLLAAVAHVLARPFRLLRMSGRDPRPGGGAQALHTDWLPRAAPVPYEAATALWILDGFTETNGATRVVPGTHRRPGGVVRGFGEPDRRHPDERVVLAPAGSLLVLNAQLWHGATRNGSNGRRRVLQLSFVAHDARAPVDAAPVADPRSMGRR